MRNMGNIKIGCQTYPWKMNPKRFAGDVPHMVRTAACGLGSASAVGRQRGKPGRGRTDREGNFFFKVFSVGKAHGFAPRRNKKPG